MTVESILAAPETIGHICAHVSSGGSLIDLCKIWEVNYGVIASWIRDDTTRSDRYDKSLIDRDEWAKERILSELRSLSHVDIREAFDSITGAIRPLADIPQDVARCITGLESLEITSPIAGLGGKREKVGELKKIKFADKIKSLEMLGKQIGMFVERHDVRVDTYEQLIAKANATIATIPLQINE